MTNDGNRVTAWIREQLKSAHWLLEATMEDVTGEMAHWGPPGMALPIGAAYAHFVTSEDWMVNVLFRCGAPLFAQSHAGKTGLSELPPGPDAAQDWSRAFADWSRRVRIDLPAFRAYAQAVYAATDGYLSSAPDTELERPMDLSAVGMGVQTAGFVLNNGLIGHCFSHCGEISSLKGVQGRKGYPF